MISEDKPEKKFIIARRFRRLRRKAMLTQADLGRHIELCRKAVSRIERSHVMLRLKSWRRFVEFEVKHNHPPVRWPKRWL
jgi:DNA-binding XRE family transcriptional regulator